MTVLSALQSASIRLVGQKPATFFGAPNTNILEMELTDLVNEVAIDICKYQDWQALTKIATLTPTGIEEISLPSDYDRQLVNSNLQQPTNWLWGYSHILDINDFLFQKNSGWNLTPGGWILYGGKVHFSPIATSQTQFPYISANYALAGTTGKAAFTADTDTFALPERLLTLGLVWRWRENKKLDASGDQEAFIKALEEVAGKDRGSSIIRFTGRRRTANTSIPYMGVAY